MPTFFTAASAYRMEGPARASSSRVKSAPERLMSGGRTAMPIRAASWRNAASLSVLFTASDMHAARNASGWFAFIHAVCQATSA